MSWYLGKGPERLGDTRCGAAPPTPTPTPTPGYTYPFRVNTHCLYLCLHIPRGPLLAKPLITELSVRLLTAIFICVALNLNSQSDDRSEL